ncbi:phenylalanine--tRNA ligase subunit beta [Candidatus Saccharibacteria bacterium]|nr:phenylalanine--tRNA ligase subunit beta [Candidatus Saccharibacteria bacterium]
MRISLNWLKKFVDIKISDDELVRLIGARLVEVEGVIDETHKYDNIYVVRVASAEKIPDTHLTLCQIDAGAADVAKVEKNEGLIQVVCGAPNVREGMLAAWIAPGATVPASVNEDAPFVIGKRKMLGKYDSYGMLAGADELDFGDDHSGIVEIDPAVAKSGDKLADVFELNDKILDIENKSLTHRPDTFGVIGFAREVAGIMGVKFAVPAFSAEALQKSAGQDTANLSISIASPDICERYSAIVLTKHGEIKKKYLTWQDTILAKSGMRPIDPIVDATNYLMLLTGQPLHAFDYDKFVAVGGTKKPQINVRLAKAGEKLTLLDGKEVALVPADIVICSGDTPVALAGAMGGASTEIDENTRNIIIESATFSLYNLRKTQMEHGIFSEAITRFTKGQPVYQTMTVAEDCAAMLADGFKIVGEADEYPKPAKQDVVKITTHEINNLLGTEYGDDLIVKTLENVGFEVKTGAELTVTAPLWRKDIHIKEDIIEEVGRLLGYDNITPTLPKHGTANVNKMLELKTRIRNLMASYGANETLTYSFVSGRLIENAGQDTKNSYKIVNSISPELQFVRQSITPSLLDKAHMNQKIPYDKFALYEFNKVYQVAWGRDAEDVPVERTRMGFVLAERKTKGAAYYKAKLYVEKLLSELNIPVVFRPMTTEIAMAKPYEPKRAAEIFTHEGQFVGVVGEFRGLVRRNFKLEDYAAGFELDLDVVLENTKNKVVSNDFVVKDKEDVTITTTKTYAEVLAEVEKDNPGAEITPLGIYQPEGAKEKNITFHIVKK